jgi:hypothetical protein
MSDFDSGFFKASLRDTVQWCAARVAPDNPKECLRTLRSYTAESFVHLSHRKRLSVVKKLIRERRAQVDIHYPPDESVISAGKLLLFYPDQSLSDGAAESASEGFLDADNAPAWDTWVFYGTDGSGSQKDWDVNILISWVPKEMISLVHHGIAVNPESCFDWASQRTRNLTQTLKNHGLLF